MTMTDDLTGDLRAQLLALTPAQQSAVELIATGSTHAAAAEAVGVTRETVTRWVGHHPAFRATLSTYRIAMATEALDLATTVRHRALSALAARVDSADVGDLVAIVRAIPALPPSGPAVTAAELLDAARQSTESTMPPDLPPGDDVSALIAQMDGTAARRRRARADRLTVARLANAAGLDTGGWVGDDEWPDDLAATDWADDDDDEWSDDDDD